MEFISHSEEETKQFGRELAASFSKNSLICFEGELGTGKTTLIKGITTQIAGIQEHEVSSPTFTYLNIYEGDTEVYHFDLYRLNDEFAFLEMGFDDYFELQGICCIEWSERIRNIIPTRATYIRMEHIREGKRKIIVK